MSLSPYLVWMDLEMTGLDPQRHRIIEIATIITDTDLNIIEIGPDLAIHQSEEILSRMDNWCVDHHGRSGLTEKVRASELTTRNAELETLAFLQKFVKKGDAPLCGNSIHQDRRFLGSEMTELNDFFHYRNIDVSTVKELYKRWYPGESKFEKKEEHTALEDIKESIAELKHYRTKIFVK